MFKKLTQQQVSVVTNAVVLNRPFARRAFVFQTSKDEFNHHLAAAKAMIRDALEGNGWKPFIVNGLFRKDDTLTSDEGFAEFDKQLMNAMHFAYIDTLAEKMMDEVKVLWAAEEAAAAA